MMMMTPAGTPTRKRRQCSGGMDDEDGSIEDTETLKMMITRTILSLSSLLPSLRVRRQWTAMACSLVIALLLATLISSPPPSTNDFQLKDEHRQQQQHQHRHLSQDLNYHSSPRFQWMAAIMTSTSSGDDDSDGPVVFGRGNAIRQSPLDDDILYATTSSGSLLVISARNGTTLATVKPLPRTTTTATTTNQDGTMAVWSLSSTSGMAFGHVALPSRSTISNDENSDNEGFLTDHIDKDDDNENDNLQHFLVYSVVETAPPGSSFLPKTRVVAVSIPQNQLLWTSAGLPGLPQGSPLIYSYDYHFLSMEDRQTPSATAYASTAILLTHNSQLQRPNDSNSTMITGHVTLLRAKDGHVWWTESEWSSQWSRDAPAATTTTTTPAATSAGGGNATSTSSSSTTRRHMGYGPPALAQRPAFGNFDGGQGNGNDLAVWTSLAAALEEDDDDQGQSQPTGGHLLAFQMPLVAAQVVENQGHLHSEGPGEANVEITLSTLLLQNVDWRASARPTLGHNGTTLFVGTTGHEVHGWVGQQDSTNGNAFAIGKGGLDRAADWSTTLAVLPSGYPRDKHAPIATSPILSLNEERIFVTSSAASNNETVCLDAHTGSHLWAIFLGSSRVVAEPRVSPDDNRVYLMLTGDDGAQLMAVDQRAGTILWKLGDICERNGGQDSTDSGSSNEVTLCDFILAEFDVSRDGAHLYFGDMRGRIVALDLGQNTSLEPPSSNDGSNGSTEGGTLSPYNDVDPAASSNQLDDDRASGPTVGVIIFVIIFTFITAVVSILYVMKLRGRPVLLRRKRKEEEDDFSSSSIPQRAMGYLNKDGSDEQNGFDDDDDDCDYNYGEKGQTIMVDVGMMYDPEPAFVDGPDRYEDTMIGGPRSPSSDSDTASTASAEHGDLQLTSSDDTEPSANQISILLGTSQEIKPASTPLNEDYGYGAAVIV